MFQDVLHHRRVGIDQPETGDVRAAVFELFHVDRVKILRNIPKHVYSDRAANEKKKNPKFSGKNNKENRLTSDVIR